MMPKACNRCRQWKVRCDGDASSGRVCSRCQSLQVACLFDKSFKRVSKTKRLQDLPSQVNQLLLSPTHGVLSSSRALDVFANTNNASIRDSTMPIGSTTTSILNPPSLTAADSSNFNRQAPSKNDKVLGDIRLTPAQIAELFKSYFTFHHQYLPFTLHQSSEVIYAKSPLLFWVICAVASSNHVKPHFEPHIRNLIATVLTSSARSNRSIHTVQALLVMCMWPFKFRALPYDPSFFYSGLATQIALQLQLHRPEHTHIFLTPRSEPSAPDADVEAKLTTWLACFVVNEMQSSCHGVPQTVFMDFSLLSSSSSGYLKVDPTLARLCYISRLHVQSSLAIGAKAQNTTGMLDAASRTDMITVFSAQYAALLMDHLQPMNNVVETAFLSSRIQLWSFALLDDMPVTSDLVEIIQQAKNDAVRLIQLGCEINISMAPYHVRRSIFYSAIILIKILKSPYATQHEVLADHIDRARQILSSAVAGEDDITQRACDVLRDLPFLEDPKLTPQIHSKMTASVIYDSLRVYSENKLHTLRTCEVGLDGFDWESFLKI